MTSMRRASSCWRPSWPACCGPRTPRLGYFGGKAFEDNHTLAFVVSFTAALAVSGLTELVRWLLHRRRKPRVGGVAMSTLPPPQPADHAGRLA
jgi:hypothetical protein